MNVTELARKLKIPTGDLLEVLPQIGFDIGKRAIKINDKLAEQIIREWPRKMRELRVKLEMAEGKREQEESVEEEQAKSVKIPSVITVKDLSSRLELPVTEVLKELMKNGILSAQNEKIDYETATIVAEDLGFKASPESEKMENQSVSDELKNILKKEEKLEYRPPVIVVMGHVDHGKTKLLDAIRKTNVVDAEAGGITQHIGAYQTEKNGKLMTFVDTPGHEAFTAMRSRGARIADIAILVVAADDGVKPQTKEAIEIIKAAGLPMLVAINKIDKEDANIDKAKGELAELGLTPEDWGGKTICVPISAKQNLHIDDLLEMVLLLADMEKENIKANPQGAVVGTVIESHINKGAGPLATILAQNGTLKTGHFLSVNNSFYGKIKAMKDWQGREVREAPPAMPVQILGFKAAPFVGDIVLGKESAHGLDRKLRNSRAPAQISAFKQTKKKDEVKAFNLIIKADVLGSLEAIITSLERIQHPSININIIKSGLGSISESDVLQAEASGALILGFHIKVGHGAEDLAREKEVRIEYYSVIYKLLEDVTAALEEMLETEIVTTVSGQMQVLKIFKTEKNNQIIGGKAVAGKITKDGKVKVIRKDLKIGQGEILELQSGKQDVSEVVAGEECGINFKGDTEIAAGDILEIYTEEERRQKIDG